MNASAVVLGRKAAGTDYQTVSNRKTSGESAPRIFFRFRPMVEQEKHSPPLHPAMEISGQTDTRQERTSERLIDSSNTATFIKSTLREK